MIHDSLTHTWTLHVMWTWELSGNLNAWIPVWRTMSAPCSAGTEWLFCQFPISFGILKINFITSIKWFRNLRFPTRVTRSKNNGFTGHRFFGIKYRYFVSAAEQIPTNDLQAASPIGRELEFVSCQCLEILRVIGPAVPGHHVCRPPVSVPVFDVDHDAQILPNLRHSCHWPNLLRKKVLTNSGWCFLYQNSH